MCIQTSTDAPDSDADLEVNGMLLNTLPISFEIQDLILQKITFNRHRSPSKSLNCLVGILFLSIICLITLTHIQMRTPVTSQRIMRL